MTHLRQAFLLLFLLGAAAPLLPQVEAPSFLQVGKEQGLSDDSYFYFLRQDSRGFIWAGNMEGLYRFDGRKVKAFRPGEGIKGTLAEKEVMSPVLEDADGHLWFSSYRYLHRMDRHTGAFRPFQLPAADGKPVTEGYFVFHLEKRKGVLWLRAGKHIFRYSTRDTTVLEVLPHTTIGNWLTVDTTENGKVSAIWASPFFREGVELFLRRPGDGWTKMHLLAGRSTEGELQLNAVANALPQSDTACWLFSSEGLARLDWRHPQDARLFAPDGFPSFPCHAGRFLDSTLLLVASRDAGLWLFDTKKKQFVGHWEKDPAVPSSLSTNKPRGLLADKQGRIWVGHLEGGIDYAAARPQPFYNPLNSVSLRFPRVETVLESPAGQLWVGTQQSGVLLLSKGGKVLEHYPARDFGYERLWQLLEDEQGRIWALTEGTIYAFQLRNGWTPVVKAPNTQFRAMALAEGGRLLASTPEGVYEWKGSPPELALTPELSDYRDFDFFRLFKTEDGAFYFPYRGSGLWIYREEDGRLVCRDTFALGAQLYSTLSTDGGMYLGTSKGLYKINEDKELKTVLATSKWGPAGNIYGVLQDDAGRFWLSSNQGLWVYDEDSDELERFRKADGLPSEAFSSYAALAASDGRFWLGHNDGLLVFHPDSVRAYPHSPEPYIEELLVNSAPHAGDTLIAEASGIRLSYVQNTLAFELRAVGYFHPELTTLRYRMKGYDDTWALAKNGGVGRFTKIPPGDYTFEYYAINANGRESPLKSLEVRITPPFWQTLWFRLLAALLAVLIILGTIRAYVQRKLRQKQLIIERQKAQSEERDRIGRELHDDVGAGLSTISFLSKSLLQKESEPKKLKQLRDISESARELFESMEEIIWALNAEDDSLESLLIKIRQYASKLLSKNGKVADIFFPDEVPAITLQGEKRRNIYLIVKESLHNMVKYSEAPKAVLNATFDEGHLLLSIEDNGRGFSVEGRKTAGNGLRNMKKRAAASGAQLEIRSQKGEGTTVKLTLPLNS